MENTMPSFKDSFKLDVNDIDLIENALRCYASSKVSEQHLSPADQMAGTTEVARQVHNLLGKIHNQKNFYACSSPNAKAKGMSDPVG